jgi:hypothetical protein
MWELLQDCWESIPGEAGWEMPRVCKAVIKAKGGYSESKTENIFRFILTQTFDWYCYVDTSSNKWIVLFQPQ